MAQHATHDPWFLALIVVTPILFLVQCLFNAFAGQPAWSGGLFLNTTGSVSDVYNLEITPAGATFSIWGVIYTWQVLWLIYSLSLVFRKSDNGYLYVDPQIIPSTMYFTYIVSEFFNVAWLFLWDRQILAASFPILLLIALTLYLGLFFIHRHLHRITPTLIAEGKVVDVWLVRLLVQNGIAFYATWCTIATLLNLGAVIAYRSHPAIDQRIASTVCLSILALEITTWFFLDMFVLDKYVRYTFSPYLVLVAALTGVVGKNWKPNHANSTFTAVLLAASIAALIIKVFVLFWRHFKHPLCNSVAVSKVDEISKT